MKPLLTIGIPTFNRSKNLNERLIDFEKLGYFDNRRVEIIIHDNDSKDKNHLQKIENLQKTVRNLFLIQSVPNIGMVKACYKILTAAKGDWITLLGDDDPIIIKCSNFVNLIRQKKEYDHLYFKPKINEAGKIAQIPWMPKLKVQAYTPSFICAKQGFTTGFAFIGAHCFRNKKNISKKWIKSHEQCLFYGHCIMLIEHFRRSFYTGRTLAAWTPGNERITHQLNVFRHLELRNLFKYPPSKKIKAFFRHKPYEVIKQGIFPLINHVNHPLIEPITQNDGAFDGRRIHLKRIRALSCNPLGAIEIFPSRKTNTTNACCVFGKRFFAKSENCGLYFECAPKASLRKILSIIAFLDLQGPIYLRDQKTSFAELFFSSSSGRAWKKREAYLTILLSIVLFGPEGFDINRIVRNITFRPRKGFYKLLRELEKWPRLGIKKLLGPALYYQAKLFLFGRKKFTRTPLFPQVIP